MSVSFPVVRLLPVSTNFILNSHLPAMHQISPKRKTMPSVFLKFLKAKLIKCNSFMEYDFLCNAPDSGYPVFFYTMMAANGDNGVIFADIYQLHHNGYNGTTCGCRWKLIKN